jgi:hypothetical protein
MLGYEPAPPMLEEFARLLIATDVTDLVVGARQPDAALRRVLADTQARCIVWIEDPLIAAADLFENTGADALLVTRAIANSCALLMGYAELPGALTIHCGGARGYPPAAVMEIADHFGIAIDEDTARRIVAEVASSDEALALPSADWAAPFPETARKTLGGVVFGYQQCIAGRGFGRLVWNRDLFFVSESQCRATEVLDLSGGARALIYGPDIHLPAGFWSAEVYLGVSAEATGCTLLIEAYAGAQLAAASLQPGSGGIFRTDLNFVLDESCRHGVEIRVAVTQDDGTGQLAFGRVVLQPAWAARRSDSIGEFEDIERVLEL